MYNIRRYRGISDCIPDENIVISARCIYIGHPWDTKRAMDGYGRVAREAGENEYTSVERGLVGNVPPVSHRTKRKGCIFATL